MLKYNQRLITAYSTVEMIMQATMFCFVGKYQCASCFNGNGAHIAWA